MKRMSLGPMSASSLNSRASLGGSGFGAAPPSDRRKSMMSTPSTASRPHADNRNVSDKDVMGRNLKKLANYLNVNKYDGVVRTLASPTTKEFNEVVLFLFKQLDPHFKHTGKLDEEIISMFRLLGYPFAIVKSSLASAGAPYSWPSLLAALIWLVDLLSYAEACKQQDEQLELESDPSASVSGFYSYLAKAYKLFLAAKDEQYEALENQFVKSFEDKDILIQDQLDALQQRNGAIMAEIESVKNRSAYLPELVQKKKEFKQTQNQFAVLVEELAQVRKEIHDKVQNRKLELSSVLNGVSALEEKITDLKFTIQTQDLSPEDVLNLVNERKRLEEANSTAAETRQAAQKKIKELEADLRSRVQSLEEAVKVYHGYAEGLKLVPASARNARGEDLSIDVDIRAKKREGLLRTEVRNHVLPILQQMKAELTQTTLELRSEKMREVELLEEMAAQRSELVENQTTMEAKQRRAEANYKREKELLDQSSAMQGSDLDSMESRLIALRDTAAEEARLTATKRRIAEIVAIRAARRAEHERKVVELRQSIMEVVSMCADHRENVQGQLEDLKAQYSSRLSTLLSGAPQEGEEYIGDGQSSFVDY